MPRNPAPFSFAKVGAAFFFRALFQSRFFRALLSGASFRAFFEHASSRAFSRNAAIQTSAFRLSAQIILAPQGQPWKLPMFLLALRCQMDENRDLSQRKRERES